MRLFLNVNLRMISYRLLGSYVMHETIQGKKDKFASRCGRCVFLGYLFGKKGWKVQDLDIHEVFIIRDAIFCEDVFLLHNKEGHLWRMNCMKIIGGSRL